MAKKFTYKYSRDTPTSDGHDDREASSRNSCSSTSTHTSHLISQRQLSDSRCPTTCFILFENASTSNSNKIQFLEYFGTRARHHHRQKLYIAQVTNENTSANESKEEFGDCIKQVLRSIPSHDLSSYVVSVRTGVVYFFSKRFRFNFNYAIEEVLNIIEKKIPLTDEYYYYPPRPNYPNHIDESLRSSFCNVKPISQPKDFVEQLEGYQFHVKQQKHVFKIYLQSEDKQTHVCTVDPALNYSIVEFSKDFQRTSNIDYIRDRHPSKFQETKTYDDVFDFRIQFQYNPRTCSDQMNTIEYELHQQFPSLDPDFKNENILRPSNTTNIYDQQEFHISKQLCPYIQFIRRDFGDVYHYTGADSFFENYTIYLESSVEYLIDRDQSSCKCELTTHGLVYARLDLNSMVSSNTIDEELLINKLWNMSGGLTYMAGQCTTSETQQSTNYYTRDGKYTAEDEILVQRILKKPVLPLMLGLTNHATDDEIKQNYDRITNQLDPKWHYIPSGNNARDKLYDNFNRYLNNEN